MAKLRLNIGAGEPLLEGFIPIDRKVGKEAYPLDYEDGTVDEIRASHILEHFNHADSVDALKEWVRVLKPGGKLRIAVPDFRKCAEEYVAGKPTGPIGSYIMGGQIDKDDYHFSLWDEDGLRGVLAMAGLVGAQRWESEIQDCARLPHSLNIEAFKPIKPLDIATRCAICSTMPRLNFTANRQVTQDASRKLGIAVLNQTGAYFDQALTRTLEFALTNGYEYIITFDYDSIFQADDIERLVMLADAHPEVGAIASVQLKRGKGSGPLFGTSKPISSVDLFDDLVPVTSAHFGLTLIRASVLPKMAKPWLHHVPDANGEWGDGRVDADVAFWHKLTEVAPLCVAGSVNIGHMQEMVTWVGPNFEEVVQHWGDYVANGKPKGVRGT